MQACASKGDPREPASLLPGRSVTPPVWQGGVSQGPRCGGGNGLLSPFPPAADVGLAAWRLAGGAVISPRRDILLRRGPLAAAGRTASGDLWPGLAVVGHAGVRGRWPGLPPFCSPGPSPGDICAGWAQGGKQA